MRKSLIFSLFISMYFACDKGHEREKDTTLNKPIVDIQNPHETVRYLCDLFVQMDNEKLSDEEYRQIQIKVEALYLGIQFGLNAGFYTADDLSSIADSLGCLF